MIGAEWKKEKKSGGVPPFFVVGKPVFVKMCP